MDFIMQVIGSLSFPIMCKCPEDYRRHTWPFVSEDSTNHGLKILGEKKVFVLNMYRCFSCHYFLNNTV
jgi:hypothetical protein